MNDNHVYTSDELRRVIRFQRDLMAKMQALIEGQKSALKAQNDVVRSLNPDANLSLPVLPEITIPPLPPGILEPDA